MIESRMIVAILLGIIAVLALAAIFQPVEDTSKKVPIGGGNEVALMKRQHKVDVKDSTVAHAIQSANCTDKLWCKIAPPAKSLFRFTTPIDPEGWRRAQLQAVSGEQVLLSKVMKHFPTFLDFIDGDTKFRKFHHLADFFVDRNRDLTPLLHNYKPKTHKEAVNEPYLWDKAKILPRDHNFRSYKRAPIFKLGYFALRARQALWFGGGEELGKALVSRELFNKHWQAVKDNVSTPFILLDVHDENWGFLSTHFPNRTAQWGDCCQPEERAHLLAFLDHPMTLMAVLNQHTNITHPKIVTLPRGLPLHNDHGARLIWDTMHSVLKTQQRKDKFVFTASTDAISRAQILSCIGKKFKPSEFIFQVSNSPPELEQRKRLGDQASNREYYRKLATSRVGIAVPGVGYDTFRLWELLTMGSVAVIERGVGLDKTVWRLPVLLVEDFDEVTPSLLRAAYVEALYRAEAGEFEFERLTQSFWWTFVMNVSTSMSQDAISAKFPPSQSEDAGFARPRVPFDCGVKGERCGPGTKRTPATSCGGDPF